MSSEHVDVLIVGAGLSGIGAACHLRTELPGKSFAILEARDAIGGTWDLFRYPGIRSDSDMFTLGYSFKPWEAAKAIADGPDILSYVREAAREFDVEREIRFGHKVVSAEWSSEDALWTVEAEHDGERVKLTCGFLFSCSGYYRYDEGYTPEFEGIERFGGQIVHPQHWPEDLDYEGKRVVVIGSGATAVTLIPAMARDTEHITMLQRSPSYVLALPGHDPVADLLRKVLPKKAAYAAIRWKNVLLTVGTYQLSRRAPKFMRAALRKGAQLQLPKGYDVDTHFNPRYSPWDQRMCIVPGGDLFKSIKRGDASVVTDTIETFTENGLRLSSGEELEADIVITATGLNVQALGGLDLEVDGAGVRGLGDRGLQGDHVQRRAQLRAGDRLHQRVVDAEVRPRLPVRVPAAGSHGRARVLRRSRPSGARTSCPSGPFIDLESGYVLRAIDQFPKQGDDAPWRLYQNYMRDVPMFRRAPIEDGALEFRRAPGAPLPSQPRRVAA